MQIGGIEAHKAKLIADILLLNKEVESTQKILAAKYGDVNINLTTGKLQSMQLIRKISVGKDYKNDAMHYTVGQEVYGGHTIENIIEEETKVLNIYIKRGCYHAMERLQ